MLSVLFGSVFRDCHHPLQVVAPLASEILGGIGSKDIVQDYGVSEFITLDGAMLA